VLEHPAFSLAWIEFALPRPQPMGWLKTLFDPGWVCEVSQCAYGHRAEKLTWLYYVGATEPPELNWSRPQAQALVSFLSNHGGRHWLPRLSKKEASATPIAFRDLLISIAAPSHGPND
jgi:hypothetical protein